MSPNTLRSFAVWIAIFTFLALLFTAAVTRPAHSAESWSIYAEVSPEGGFSKYVKSWPTQEACEDAMLTDPEVKTDIANFTDNELQEHGPGTTVTVSCFPVPPAGQPA